MSLVRVANASDLEQDRPLAVTAQTPEATTLSLVLVRDSAGAVHALRNACTHQDVPLSEGEIEGDTLECWVHGSCFDLKTGKPDAPPAITPVDVFRAEVDPVSGDISVDVSAPINK